MNSFQLVKNFSRNTGIKDAKLDTFLKMQEREFMTGHISGHVFNPISGPTSGVNTTYGVDMGMPSIDMATITFWHQKIKEGEDERRKLWKKYFEGDWTPHKRQRDFFTQSFKRGFDYSKVNHDAGFDWVIFDEARYTEEVVVDAEYRVVDETVKKLRATNRLPYNQSVKVKYEPRGRATMKGIKPYDKED